MADEIEFKDQCAYDPYEPSLPGVPRVVTPELYEHEVATNPFFAQVKVHWDKRLEEFLASQGPVEAPSQEQQNGGRRSQKQVPPEVSASASAASGQSEDQGQ